MSEPVDFRDPDVFTAGAVGPPGQRTFYLQAREAEVVLTLKCEKEQVAALAEYLGRLVAKLPRADEAPGDLDLSEPVVPAWAVGSIGVGYDEGVDRLVLVVRELVEEPDEDAGEEGARPRGDEAEREEARREGAVARFRLRRAQAAAFVERAREVVRAGRPPCPVCGGPRDPTGHVCPRSNGHHLR